MKNITVLAIAWVVWFCVCWWFAGFYLEGNEARKALLIATFICSLLVLLFTTIHCALRWFADEKIR